MARDSPVTSQSGGGIRGGKSLKNHLVKARADVYGLDLAMRHDPNVRELMGLVGST